MAYKRKYRSRRKSYRKSRRGRSSRRGRNFQTRVKRVLQKTAETKYFDIAEENVQLNHNLGTSALATSSIAQLYNPWADIIKGTSRQDRIGDKITPRGMSLKLWLANKADRPNLMYRFMVIRCPKSLQGSLTTYQAYPFQTANLASAQNIALMPLDKDRGFRALYDRVITINSTFNLVPGQGYKEAHIFKKLWIKRKNSRPIVYDGSHRE
jgi:hypothetical protein